MKLGNAGSRSKKKQGLAGPKKAKLRSHSSDISLLEPTIREPSFDSFSDLAKSYDALINEFYRYYRESSSDEPNMFGFVTLRHTVKFTDRTDCIYTENIIGQKTNVIYAPLIEGETGEDKKKGVSLYLQLLITQKELHISLL